MAYRCTCNSVMYDDYWYSFEFVLLDVDVVDEVLVDYYFFDDYVGIGSYIAYNLCSLANNDRLGHFWLNFCRYFLVDLNVDLNVDAADFCQVQELVVEAVVVDVDGHGAFCVE